MKKSINIGLILFLLLQACSSSENTENQASVEPISEDTPINEPAEPNNPPPPGDDNAPPKDDKGQDGGPTVNEALTILEDVSDDVIRCIDNDVYGLYDQYLNGYIPDEYEAKVVVTCFNNPEAYGPIDGDQAGSPPGEPDDGSTPPDDGRDDSEAPGEPDDDNNPPPANDEDTYEDYENFYTYFGGPAIPEQREYLSYQYLGSTTQDSVAELESIFFGQSLPNNVDTFNDALYKSGWLQNTCPFDATNLGEVKDLGLVIDYNTPGITAIPMNDPGFLSRDKGLETMADPSVVLLDDSTIALYFTGDHRASNQSSRWVSSAPVTSVNDTISFSIESDYNLLTRLNWRNMFYENGSWTSYGALGTLGVSTWYKWTSTDGLEWSGQTELLTAGDINTYREAQGYVAEDGASAYVTKINDSEYYAVFTGYREDFEKPNGTDVNGDGVVAGEYVVIYKSTDGNSWSYHDVFHGGSEAVITKTITGEYVLTSTTGCTYLSTDAKNWGYGFNAKLYGSVGDMGNGVLLADGWRLVFGTSSNVGMPLAASKITNTSISDLYLKAMKNYIPSVDEIEVPYEFNY
jgi:hypothetical protein